MGRTGVSSGCFRGIPVLHFQECLFNPQGATDGWQTDNLVSLTIFQ